MEVVLKQAISAAAIGLIAAFIALKLTGYNLL
jgi:hypothetical protein